MALPYGIENHHIDVYSSNINQLAQVRGFLFSGKIREENKHGEVSWHDTILPVEHTPVAVKGGDTPWTDPGSFRRGVSNSPFRHCAPLYKDDAILQLTTPTSALIEQQVASRQRVKNRIVIASMLNAAMQKVDGHDAPYTLETLPTANKIAVDYGSPGTNTPITTGKLRALRQVFLDTGEKGFEDGTEEIYLLVSPSALMAFLAWVEVNSTANVASVQALIDGKMNRFLGFTWVTSPQIPFESGSTIRPIIAWAKNGMLYNEWQTLSRVDERPDKDYAVQVYDKIWCGGVRLNDQLIHAAYCDEA
jgi:hypothetical protein